VCCTGMQGKALRKRSSRLGDVEWTKATWGEERVKAVTKAVDRVYEMALDQDNFDYFGNDMIQVLLYHDIYLVVATCDIYYTTTTTTLILILICL
jgi:hypothetical protein